jgi:hypothetical protein
MGKVVTAAAVLAGALIVPPVFAERNRVTPTPVARQQQKTDARGKGKMPAYEKAAPVTPPEPEDARAIKFGRDQLKGTTKVAETSEPRMMTGKVISQSGNTFKVISSGKGKMPAYERQGATQEFTFSAAKLKVLPGVGEIIDITYTQTSDGTLEATTINTTRSNTF